MFHMYSWLPIAWSNPRKLEPRANSNQNRFPLDFRHTFNIILLSVTRTSRIRSGFCFPSDHFYIILPSKTRTMFWALRSREKTVYWRRSQTLNFELNLPLTCCRHIVYYRRLMLFVTNLTWNSFFSQNRKTETRVKQGLLSMLRSDL